MTQKEENKMNESPKKGKAPKDWTEGCQEEKDYNEWRKKKLKNGSKHA